MSKETQPVPRWLADAVQAMALVRGERVTAETLGVRRADVPRLAAMLPVSLSALQSAIDKVPLELRPAVRP